MTMRLFGEQINEFGNWAVTTYGLEFLPFSYPIEKERLDQDWETVTERKKAEFQIGFTEALEFARQYHSVIIDGTKGIN
ncbi:MAG TPA: hypothetical protein VF791_23320 [Pyrinomonadaceae bacterium]